MTTRETVAVPSLEEAVPSASLAHARRFARWLRERGWVHVLLWAWVAACVSPVTWMVATSLMTDEELGQERATPQLPVMRAASPYVREPVHARAPDGVTPERFAALAPRLQEEASARVLETIGALGPTLPPVDRSAWAASAASVLFARAIAQIPRQAWNDEAPTLSTRVAALGSEDAVAAALSDRLARVELGSLTLRTRDGHIHDIASGQSAAEWRVASGSASIVAASGALRLDYAFDRGASEPIVLVHDFRLPDGVEPADLHKLVLMLRSDDTWNGLDATLDVGGTHWASSWTTWLGQNRTQSVSFQPPGFDDTTIRARTWVPLHTEGPSDRGREARLRLVLSKSSVLGASLAKLTRNYVRAIRSVPFATYVRNSLILVVLTVLGATASSAFVAYAFARLTWPGRSVALMLLLSTMMIPPQVTMIPSFLVWRGLGWYNTLNPLWVPAWLGNAFFIFLMVQHMRTIPRELEEAARIDGLGVVQTWWYVIVPQLRPSLAAIAVMSFLGAWNEFMGPLIYLRDQSKFPLSLGLFGMRLDYGADWSMLMAATVLMTLPPALAFLRFQRHLIEGVTVTGMKG